MRTLTLTEREVNYVMTVLVNAGAIDACTGMAVPGNTTAEKIVDFIVDSGTVDAGSR